MTRAAAEAIVREAGPEFWLDGLDGEVAHIINTASDDPDRGGIAHDLWALGGGLDHTGCRYGGEEPNDADYENSCEECEQYLLGVADKLIAALNHQKEV